jgi:hypothetical protein
LENCPILGILCTRILKKKRRASLAVRSIIRRKTSPAKGASGMATNQLTSIIHYLRRVEDLSGGGIPDRKLLESFITRRDEAAFAVLIRRHGTMVLGVCRRVLQNVSDAEDAFQATFLVLVRKAASIGQRELLSNWLYGVAYRTALGLKVAARRQPQESGHPHAAVRPL